MTETQRLRGARLRALPQRDESPGGWLKRLGWAAVRRSPLSSYADEDGLVGELVGRRLADPRLAEAAGTMTAEQAANHYGEDNPLGAPNAEHLRRVVRYFHAWTSDTLRRRIGERLPAARIVDVGDSDGLLLKSLGKDGIGVNISEAALRNIRSNGVEAQFGDCHALPFPDDAFDYVICFETVEHVESPVQVLAELARVCRPDGRVFVTIPWVPRTNIHARNPASDRGQDHIFELARDDFGALVTHTPLEIVWDDVCDVLGEPATLAQRLLLLRSRSRYILGSTFRKFQFFELAHRSSSPR